MALQKTIILARHGNTFAAGDKVVWTGSSNDLPLVSKGFEQAENVAAWLQKNAIIPEQIYCSELQRTEKFAEKISDDLQLNLRPSVAPELGEVDYGHWTGKTDDEVIQEFGQEALDDWRFHSKFPPEKQWFETEEQVVARVGKFIEKILQSPHKNILIISSNGVLRYFLKFIDGVFDRAVLEQNFAVKTGHVCRLEYVGERLNLVSWNEKP